MMVVQGLRYVACDQGCRVEALSSSFPRLDANTASTSRFAFGDFERTFALPSGGLQTLSARPTLPAACAAAAKGSLTLTTDPCLPFGLPCGTSCLCLGCTDGDPCTGTPLTRPRLVVPLHRVPACTACTAHS